MKRTLFVPRTRRRRIALGAVLLLGLAVSGVAIAGSAGKGVPGLGVVLPKDKAAAARHTQPATDAPETAKPAPEPAGAPDRIPADTLDPDAPVPISPQILDYTNGWLVSDGVTLVAVYAGAAGNDAAEGRFVIVRQNLVRGEQRQSVVDTGRTGAVTISSAPEGAAVETSAQRGDLVFRTEKGVKGSLHLATDTVTVAG